MLVCFCLFFLILFNACKYFKRPLGNQLPKCVEGLPFLNKSHNNNGNFINLSKNIYRALQR